MLVQRRMLLMVAMVAALAITAIGLPGPAPRSAAQEADADYELQINGWQCLDEACEDPANAGGLLVEATSEDGSVSYGSCETPFDGIPNTCSIMVPGGTTIVATLDESTVPEGFVPVENPIVYDVPEEKTQVGDISFNLVEAATEAYPLQVMVQACDDEACNDPVMVDGGIVEATSADGEESYGSCTTVGEAAPGGCTIDVPAGTTVNVWFDESTAPAGYAPVENPVVYDVPAEKTGAGDVTITLLLVEPAPEPTEAPEEPTDTPDEPEAPMDGRIAGLFMAPCDTEDRGDMMFKLTDLVPASGDSVGSGDAIPVETSFTAIDASGDVLLDELEEMGGEISLVVFDVDDPDQAVACGMIGGETDGETLTFGLREVDDSGYSGIVYFAIDPADDSQVQISIFLAQELTED